MRNSMTYAPGDKITVTIDGHPYETFIDARGVQRFKKNTVIDYMFKHDTHGQKIDETNPSTMHTRMLNLNILAVAYFNGEIDKQDYIEMTMPGYSVSGFCGLSYMKDCEINNPVWDDEEKEEPTATVQMTETDILSMPMLENDAGVEDIR